jgi:hypothetical protein
VHEPVRNSTIPEMHEHHLGDFRQREDEARHLLRDDLETMLDEAAAMIRKAEAAAERAWTTYDFQAAAHTFVRAAMLAEVAFELNCEDTNSEQCFRSGELINSAQDGIERLITAARNAGVQEAARAHAAAPKKKGWFLW